VIANQSLAGMDTRNKAGEGELTLCLPAGFDVESLPGNGERPVRVAYVANLITTRPQNRRGFVPLNKMRLRSIVSRNAETEAFKFLAPFLEIDHHFRPGKESKGYRWRNEFQEAEVVPHTFHAPRFRKRLEGWKEEIRSTYSELEMILEGVMKLADLPVPNLAEIVAKLPAKPGVISEVHRKRVILSSGVMIQNGDMGLIRTSGRTGRVHCSINRLSSSLRGLLTLDGERVVELDLASSQPYFLTTIFRSPNLVEAVEAGEFYERINERLATPQNLSDGFIYGDFKQSVLAALYARPVNGFIYWKEAGNKCANILGAMDKAFPGMVSFLNQYREKMGDTALAIALQKAESGVFIGKILFNLQRKGVKAIPIHDAILCQEGRKEEVRRELEEGLKRKTGVRPKEREGRK
jgi:hypothetical protein